MNRYDCSRKPSGNIHQEAYNSHSAPEGLLLGIYSGKAACLGTDMTAQGGCHIITNRKK